MRPPVFAIRRIHTNFMVLNDNRTVLQSMTKIVIKYKNITPYDGFLVWKASHGHWIEQTMGHRTDTFFPIYHE